MTTTFIAGLGRLSILTFLLVFTASLLSAQTQTPDEDLQRANKQYDLYAYNLAMRSYEQVLKKDPYNGHALARIADCYFQLNKPEEALPWYDKAVYQSVSSSDVLFRYGKALMYTGDYVGAKKWFTLYAADDEKKGKHYADMCDYALRTNTKDPLYAVKDEALSTASSDFGPAFLGNRIVYSSSRTDITRKTDSKTKSDWTGSAANQLFVTQRNPETNFLQKPVFLHSDMQNNYNEGPLSYSADGRKVVFCRNKFIDGSRQIADKGLEMSLYTADVDNGSWTNIKPFPFNGSGFATGFPSLSPDANMLFFASNNPEGFGGWDLYVSFWNGSAWSTPRNLGAAINSAGNEVTPYYDGVNLYFSSDWHFGLGGLDIFRAEINPSMEVTGIYHLGPGINSSRDDYGFIYNSEARIGYMTSNRADGRGAEDVWQVVKKQVNEPVKPAMANNAPAPAQYNTTSGNPTSTKNPGTVSWPSKTTATPTPAYGGGTLYLQVSDQDGRPVPDAQVDLSGCGAGVGLTDANGRYYFNAKDYTVRCEAIVRKAAYEEARVQLDYFGKNNVLVAIAADAHQVFNGYVYDAVTKQPLYGVVVEFEENESSIQTSTDFDGKYTVSLKTRTTYDMNFSQNGYYEAAVKVRPEIGVKVLQPVLLTRNVQAAASSPTAPAQYSTTAASPTPTVTVQSNGNGGWQILKSKDSEDASTPLSGYSVQVGAHPEALTNAHLAKYEDLSKYGNVYAKDEKGMNKVRLGVFPNKDEALKAQKQIAKNAKFKDAFVVEERGAEEELIIRPQTASTSPAPAQYSTQSAKSPQPVVLNNDVRYAVQVGAFAADKMISLADFGNKLSDLGNVYSKIDNNSLKIRVGIWGKHEDAEAAQQKAVERGYGDALVITEKASDPNVSGFILSDATQQTPSAPTKPAEYSSTPAPVERPNAKSAPAPAQYSTSSPAPVAVSNYKIRLATLATPDAFDTDLLLGMGGTLEKKQASNGGTIFLLSGFPDLDAANSAHLQLLDRGLKDSFIVKDEKGQLLRVK
jgi:hypothetical protein